MLKYFISCFCLIFAINTFSQEQKNDTINYKTSYGLRVGLDISKPVLGAFDSNYSGLEFVADYRILRKFYLATEIGSIKNTTTEDYLRVNTKGNYAKIGINYNAYQNWLDMNNEIFVGFRYGFSSFDQTLKSYTINTGSDYFPGNPNTNSSTANNLNAHWTELVFGVKAEVIKNVFVGFSFSYNILLSIKDPTNFKSLYVPGFNRVFESNTGFGFNYTISYIIPFFKK